MGLLGVLLGLLLARCNVSPTGVEGLRFACTTDEDCVPGVACVGGECGGKESPTLTGWAQGVGPGPGCPTAQELCSDGLDNDCDGLTDCLDADCSGLSCGTGCACAGGARAEASCGDAADNDTDGLTDCDDPSCTGRLCGAGCVCRLGGKVEVSCQDGLDNDGDGRVDCLDKDCIGKSCGTGCVCEGATSSRTFEFICYDGVDNNLDGFADCDEGDCIHESCEADGGMGCRCGDNKRLEVNCADGVDNDGDGLTDCDDVPDCLGEGACPTTGDEWQCGDGLDNDGDGRVDCLDSDCNGKYYDAGVVCEVPFADGGVNLIETNCNDGIDNDGDGYIDDNDGECLGKSCGPGCISGRLDGGNDPYETICDDGLDNDDTVRAPADGADCLDSDGNCYAMRCGPHGRVCDVSACVCSGNGGLAETAESICRDGFDNDCDGLTDCEDPDCLGRLCDAASVCCLTGPGANACRPMSACP